MKSTTRNMIYTGYALAIVALIVVIFHRQLSHNPDDTTVKSIGLGILLLGALLRITGMARKKKEDAMSGRL